MNQTRLSSLALMHVHYEHVIDTDKVIDIFCARQPRKLELSGGSRSSSKRGRFLRG